MNIETYRRLREAILSGRVDPDRLEKAVNRRWSTADLCPRCAIRPQERPKTGLCDECHMNELADNLLDTLTPSPAQKRHWVAKQQRSRAMRA